MNTLLKQLSVLLLSLFCAASLFAGGYINVKLTNATGYFLADLIVDGKHVHVSPGQTKSIKPYSFQDIPNVKKVSVEVASAADATGTIYNIPSCDLENITQDTSLILMEGPGFLYCMPGH